MTKKKPKKYADTIEGDLQQLRDESKKLGDELYKYLLEMYLKGVREGKRKARRELLNLKR